jgi:hypothetical protein
VSNKKQKSTHDRKTANGKFDTNRLIRGRKGASVFSSVAPLLSLDIDKRIEQWFSEEDGRDSNRHFMEKEEKKEGNFERGRGPADARQEERAPTVVVRSVVF